MVMGTDSTKLPFIIVLILHAYAKYYTDHCVSVVNCGSPQPPVNGMVTNITSTLEGSEVTFQCNTLTAICNRDGRWSPTPGKQVCGYNSGS